MNFDRTRVKGDYWQDSAVFFLVEIIGQIRTLKEENKFEKVFLIYIHFFFFESVISISISQSLKATTMNL